MGLLKFVMKRVLSHCYEISKAGVMLILKLKSLKLVWLSVLYPNQILRISGFREGYRVNG